MPQRRVVVTNPTGLHARPAARFVQVAAASGLVVTVAKVGGEAVDARSILSVLGLDVRGGDEIQIVVDGVGDGTASVLDQLSAVVTWT